MLELKERLASMRANGEESIVYGKGYLILHNSDKHCTVTFAAHTTLLHNGELKHDEPRATVEISLIKGDGLGEGSVEELLNAAADGRFETDNVGALVAAIKRGDVLYLKRSSRVLVIVRKEINSQYIDNQQFYTSTQREEALHTLIDTMRKCGKKLFSKGDIDDEDIITAISFIGMRLP